MQGAMEQAACRNQNRVSNTSLVTLVDTETLVLSLWSFGRPDTPAVDLDPRCHSRFSISPEHIPVIPPIRRAGAVADGARSALVCDRGRTGTYREGERTPHDGLRRTSGISLTVRRFHKLTSATGWTTTGKTPGKRRIYFNSIQGQQLSYPIFIVPGRNCQGSGKALTDGTSWTRPARWTIGI